MLKGDALKRWLRFHGITQHAFAQAMGVSLRTVQRWVRTDEALPEHVKLVMWLLEDSREPRGRLTAYLLANRQD